MSTQNVWRGLRAPGFRCARSIVGWVVASWPACIVKIGEDGGLGAHSHQFTYSSHPVQGKNKHIVKMVDAEAVKKICDIYDWDGKGELDLFFLGDIMYALGMNTTKKVCVGLGQTDEEGKKFAKFDDIVEKVNAAKTTPDSSGTYHDYIELLKLYDKNSNGTMMLAELENILANLGDEIPKEDVQKLFAELCDPEDEDGFFPYMPFVDRLCGKA